MKRIAIILLIISVLLAGCGPGEKTLKNLPKEEQAFSNDFKTVAEYPIGDNMAYLLYVNSFNEEEVMTPTPSTPFPEMDLDDAIGFLSGGKTNWPKEYLSPDMPPYTKGKIVVWNNSEGEFNVFIRIKDTNQQDLDEYIKELEKNGFYENNGRYCKDTFSIELDLYGNTLDIDSYKEDVTDWPDDLLGFVPPITDGYLTSVNPPSEDTGNYGDLYFIELTEEAIDAWEAELKSKGFEVESRSYTLHDFKHKGKLYKSFSAFFENNGGNEWMLYFTFEE